MGVDNVRDVGTPTDFHSGNSNSRPITNACSPNEDSVIQLRRVRWAHEVSSMLSANMVCSNIVSSSVKSVCWYGHHELAADNPTEKIKAAFSRGLLELSEQCRCRAYCFGGSLGLGAGFVAPVPVGGLGAGGFVAPVVGAGTPDFTLYASTTALVMSTA